MNVQPSYSEFLKKAKRGNIIPVWTEFPADLETPVSVFVKLCHGQKNAFLLESVELGERLGRYSFIGTEPEAVFEYQSGRCLIERTGKKSQFQKSKNLLGILTEYIKNYRFVPEKQLPAFSGGLVGYLGYELVSELEEIRLRKKKGLPVPDAIFFFCRNLVAFDHIKHHLKIIHLASVDGSAKSSYVKAVRSLKRAAASLAKPFSFQLEPKQTTTAHPPLRIKSNVSRAHFEAMVRRAKSYIRAGDCIQVVLSQRLSLGRIQDDFALYRALRSLNPSPYMFYFRRGSFSLVGSSPEMLTRKTGSLAEIKPIAGTRPRGKTEAEDQAYREALKHSSKEMAEHLMLVDLGRNDLGRVSIPKSVRVDQFARIEPYSHVMHLVSDIRGTLKKGKTAFHLLKAAFPAGTVTGAPKIRAMQIIDELEPEKRGPYAGALGYFSLTGDMDMCITIRTIVVNRRQGYIQAGAGIVNDSIPKNEFQETMNKAKALLQAVAKVQGRSVP